MRTIQSPGVEIKEVDLSLRQEFPVGTNVFLTGFTSQGPTYEVFQITSLEEFEKIYGNPTNPAENYSYVTAREILSSPANLYFGRIPYGGGDGDGFGTNYSALVFPVGAVPSASAPASTSFQTASAFYFGEPKFVTLSEAQYSDLLAGNFTWALSAGTYSFTQPDSGTPISDTSLSAAGMIVLNKSRTTIDDIFQGYYFNITDTFNLNPATSFDAAVKVKTINSTNSAYVEIPSTRLGFNLSSAAPTSTDYRAGTLSEEIEQIPTFEVGTSSFTETLIASVFKLRPSVYGNGSTTLERVFEEGFFGSLNFERTVQDVNGGPSRSFYFKNIVNGEENNRPRSQYLNILLNPNITERSTWYEASVGTPETPNKNVYIYNGTSANTTHTPHISSLNPANNLYPLGYYNSVLGQSSQKSVGLLMEKLDRMLRKVEDPDVVPIDITVDGGMSTIWANIQSLSATSFDDTANVTLGDIVTSSPTIPTSQAYLGWKSVTDKFVDLAQNVRRDHIFISDPLRYVLVKGENLKTILQKGNNFSQHIYWPLRNLYASVNTNYATTYANWVKVSNKNGSFSWAPFSGFAAKIFATTDSNVAPWSAPAGLNRGIVSNALDIAVTTSAKQRDLLYKSSLNPVAFFPDAGITVWGQKTLQTKPSAFDRINVRRLFLVLEKAVLAPTRYFVFEPNTVFTRSRLVNTITPIFELAKNTEGLYDYIIVCDERNNTPDVIDRNEMKVDIYIKPVRTAEFILVNFYATRTNQDFNELI